METNGRMKSGAPPIYGLVLMGGRSTRMGRDKSLLDYNGMPQREFLFKLLQKHCAAVYTSCRKEQEVPDHFSPLYDRHAYHGPINGILTAFDYMPSVCWLIIAVDMPFISGATLEMLIQQRDRSRPATCFLNPKTQLPEPLLTLWEDHAYPLLKKFIKEGKTSPREFLHLNDAKTLIPPDERILTNINYPDLSSGKK